MPGTAVPCLNFEVYDLRFLKQEEVCIENQHPWKLIRNLGLDINWYSVVISLIWAGNVARMGGRRDTFRGLEGDMIERDYLARSRH